MNLTYGIPLLALLVLAFLAVRRVAMKARQRDSEKRRQRRSRPRYAKVSDGSTQRSDMRATDSPVTIIDTIRKRVRAPQMGQNAKTPERRR